jgi:hypothetical protein
MSSASCTSFPNTPAGESNVSLAPHVLQDVRQEIERQGSLVQDLDDLTADGVGVPSQRLRDDRAAAIPRTPRKSASGPEK